LKTFSSKGQVKTPYSWSFPSSIMNLQLDEKSQEVCPTVSLKKFQRICVSVLFTICKGYTLFLNIPEDKDLARIRSFPFFDVDRFMEVRGKQASMESYQKDLIPFIGSFVRSQFFSLFIQGRIMNEREDFFDVEVRRKSMRRLNREKFLRKYSHYGFMWKLGCRIPSWNYRVFELRDNILSYWKPTKETEILVKKYTRVLKTSRIEERENLKRRLQSLLLIDKKCGFVKLDDTTNIDIPQNRKWHLPTRHKVPTELTFEIIVNEPLPRRLRCCAEDESSRKL